uniref:Uncharacterized protein n=1 Tax=Ditylenchus dipsaci TaxID=166011 RepID=A0A915EI26_9BILA
MNKLRLRNINISAFSGQVRPPIIVDISREGKDRLTGDTSCGGRQVLLRKLCKHWNGIRLFTSSEPESCSLSSLLSAAASAKPMVWSQPQYSPVWFFPVSLTTVDQGGYEILSLRHFGVLQRHAFFSFCRDRIRLLDVIESFGNQEVPFEYFVKHKIGVEIYYSKDVTCDLLVLVGLCFLQLPLYLGLFNKIETIGVGTSRLGGMSAAQQIVSQVHSVSCSPIKSQDLSPVLKESTRRKRKTAQKCAVSLLSVKRSRIMEGSCSYAVPASISNEAEVHLASAASALLQSVVSNSRGIVP